MAFPLRVERTAELLEIKTYGQQIDMLMGDNEIPAESYQLEWEARLNTLYGDEGARLARVLNPTYFGTRPDLTITNLSEFGKALREGDEINMDRLKEDRCVP